MNTLPNSILSFRYLNPSTGDFCDTTHLYKLLISQCMRYYNLTVHFLDLEADVGVCSLGLGAGLSVGIGVCNTGLSY